MYKKGVRSPRPAQILVTILISALCLHSSLAAQPHSSGTGEQVHGAFAVQRARNVFLAAQSTKRYYSPGQFDLRDLPEYVPTVQITGTVRVWTSDMWGNAGFRERLAKAFYRLQPQASLEFVSISPGGAFAGLLTGLADVAIGRRMTWVELLSYQRKFNRDPLVIRGMTGWFVNPPFIIAVNKDNPTASLSLAQLDGIFGAERKGGWRGMTWDPAAQRGSRRTSVSGVRPVCKALGRAGRSRCMAITSRISSRLVSPMMYSPEAASGMSDCNSSRSQPAARESS